MPDSTTNPEKNLNYLEWLKCQDTISGFDKMILDIRKYGFTFITLLLTANGFLLGKEDINEYIALGILAVLLILIVALFRIDHMHEIFLRAVALRAMRLEEKINFGLTRCISYWSESLITATWGTVIYALFCIAAFILTTAAIIKHNGAVEPVNKIEHPATSIIDINADRLYESLNFLLEDSKLRVMIVNPGPISDKTKIDNEAELNHVQNSSDSTLATKSNNLETLMRSPAFYIACIFLGASLICIIKYNLNTRLREIDDNEINTDKNDPFRAHIIGI